MSTSLDGPAVEAAADLGKSVAWAAPIKLNTGEEIDNTLVVRVVDNTTDVEIHDLERYLEAPRHARGGAVMHDADSFAEYVTRLVGGVGATGPMVAQASLWADDAARSVVCVFNDHGDGVTPGWRDLRATYNARVDPDWQRWRDHNTKPMTQLAFGEFLQDMAHSIVEPAAASLVQTAMSFTAKRNLQFESAARIDTGDINLVYRETTKAEPVRGNIEMPAAIVIQTPVFYGRPAIQISARIRPRIQDGQLQISYVLQRPDIAERESFDEICTGIDTNTPDIHFMMGTAPAALR
jgi:uncharacterized protein YfdQ (DUF2303 family)